MEHGALKAPRVANVEPVEVAPPAPQGDTRKPVEGGVARPEGFDPGAVRRAVEGNTWGAPHEGAVSFAEALAARVEARREGREAPIPTPWPNVNDALGGGVWPGFHVLVGATGAGKSQWAMQLAMHAAATAGVPVLYVALELDAFGLFCRAAATLAWGRVSDDHGKPASPQWSELYTGKARVPPFAAGELGALPFHWCEAPPHGFHYEALAPHVEALRAVYAAKGYAGPVLVVVDFLQLLAGDAREDLRERVGRAAYACRAIARDMNAAVIALSSTARQPPGRSLLTVARDDDGEPKRAALHDLVGLGKESGDVEYSADSVMVLCREEWPDGEPPPPGGRRVHVGVAKLRAGVGRWAVLAFNGTTFRPAEGDDAPSSAGAGALPSRGKRGKRGKVAKGDAQSSAPHDPRFPEDRDDDATEER